ncbi:MAG: glycosyl transferase family 2, partial [Lachnospiraceae bacterium]
VQKGLAITHSSGSYLTEPESWGYALYDYGAIGAYRIGSYELARSYAIKACELNPSDERLKLNLKLIEEKCLK